MIDKKYAVFSCENETQLAEIARKIMELTIEKNEEVTQDLKDLKSTLAKPSEVRKHLNFYAAIREKLVVIDSLLDDVQMSLAQTANMIKPEAELSE